MVFDLWTKDGGHGAPGIELAYTDRSQQEVEVILAGATRAGGTVWEVAHNPDRTIEPERVGHDLAGR